jgi:hypothetical protein
MARKILYRANSEKRPSIDKGFLDRPPDEIESNIARVNHQLHKAGINYTFSAEDFAALHSRLAEATANTLDCSSILNNTIAAYLRQITKMQEVAQIVNRLKSIVLAQFLASSQQNADQESADDPAEELKDKENKGGPELSGSIPPSSGE